MGSQEMSLASTGHRVSGGGRGAGQRAHANGAVPQCLAGWKAGNMGDYFDAGVATPGRVAAGHSRDGMLKSDASDIESEIRVCLQGIRAGPDCVPL